MKRTLKKIIDNDAFLQGQGPNEEEVNDHRLHMFRQDFVVKLEKMNSVLNNQIDDQVYEHNDPNLTKKLS